MPDSLIETEFFRKLTDVENYSLHIAFKDFMLQDSKLCNKEPHKWYVISALLDEGIDKPLTNADTTQRGQ